MKDLCPLPVAVAGSSVIVNRQSSSAAVTKMAGVVLEFKSSAGDFEPQSRHVLIIGQLANLQQVSWNQIKGKLQPGVSKEVRNKLTNQKRRLQ